jgi:hypothetical protein
MRAGRREFQDVVAIRADMCQVENEVEVGGYLRAQVHHARVIDAET